MHAEVRSVCVGRMNTTNRMFIHLYPPVLSQLCNTKVKAILEVCGSLGVTLKRGACCCTCKDRENLARTRKIVWFFVNMSDQRRVLRASGHTKKNATDDMDTVFGLVCENG